jgi:hypothetical protein
LNKLEIHPLCEVAPRMTPAEYAALVADVKETGKIREPAVKLDGKILDGRHRQDAAFDAGVPLPTIDFDPAWGSPVRYVYSKLIHRNLAEGQKACAAVGIEEELAKEAAERQRSALKQYRGGTHATTEGVNGKSRDLAGQLFGVSGRLVQEAKLLKRQNPKLFEEVFRGRLTVASARNRARAAVRRRLLARKAAAAPNVHSAAVETGDCLDILPTLKGRQFRLVFWDPPYNEGVDYGDGPKADLLPQNKYLDWIERGFEEAARVLTPDGSLIVLISEDYVAEFKLIVGSNADAWGLHFQGWVIWVEEFGVYRKDYFGRCARHLLHFVKDPENFVFNEDVARVPSFRQFKYADPRAHPAGKILPNVWDIKRLPGTHKERVIDAKTQLPLDLLRLIVGVSSDPGDEVLDFNCGSGRPASPASSWGGGSMGSRRTRTGPSCRARGSPRRRRSWRRRRRGRKRGPDGHDAVHDSRRRRRWSEAAFDDPARSGGTVGRTRRCSSTRPTLIATVRRGAPADPAGSLEDEQIFRAMVNAQEAGEGRACEEVIEWRSDRVVEWWSPF